MKNYEIRVLNYKFTKKSLEIKIYQEEEEEEEEVNGHFFKHEHFRSNLVIYLKQLDKPKAVKAKTHS